MEKTIWLKILPILFLVATFEHCYAILSHFDGGLNFPVVTTVLLVLAIGLLKMLRSDVASGQGPGPDEP